MAVQIIAIRLSGGTTHEHIVRLWWTNPSDGTSGDNSRAEVVAWIEDSKGTAFVQDARSNRANVGVITPHQGQKYLRTHADGVWTDNLLALPQR